MSHVRSLRFDTLEARKLLTKTHIVAAIHAVPAIVTAPLVLNGTLTVNNKATATAMNADGSSTNVTPVSGQLGTLGHVRGTWNETVDSFGNYEGPDTLQLRASKGTLILTFSNQNPGPAHSTGNGNVYYQHTQQVYRDTGAFAGTFESGSIQLVTNHAKKLIQSLVLETSSS